MFILVTSDSHRNTDVLENLVKKYPMADFYLHAGDSERREFELEPFLTVKGNCDFHIANKYRLISVENYRIYIFHGHFTKLSLDILAAIAKNNECNIIIHGHTHVPYYTYYDGVHILCPGSVVSGRSNFGASYAIIRIQNQEIEFEIKKVENGEKC